MFTNAGPNDLVVEKNTNVGHISFLFLDSKFIGLSKIFTNRNEMIGYVCVEYYIGSFE